MKESSGELFYNEESTAKIRKFLSQIGKPDVSARFKHEFSHS